MSAEETIGYRTMVRCNFLGCDRPGIQYVAKESSHWMSSPCQGHREKLVRIGSAPTEGTIRWCRVCLSVGTTV